MQILWNKNSRTLVRFGKFLSQWSVDRVRSSSLAARSISPARKSSLSFRPARLTSRRACQTVLLIRRTGTLARPPLADTMPTSSLTRHAAERLQTPCLACFATTIVFLRRAFLIFAILLLLFSSLSASEVRRPAVAGLFYPGNKKALINQIDKFLKNVPNKKEKGKLLALIVPHAGYIYSGQVAAYAYKELLNRDFSTVIIIGPSHYLRFSGVSVDRRDFWQTPLGKVAVDKKLAERLIKEDKRIKFYPDAHLKEHSIEVEIPFLQRTLKDFKIVPIVMGEQSRETCQILSQALIKNIEERNILLIASSDMSHYHPYREACRMDRLALSDLEKYDLKTLSRHLARGECELCGAGAVMVVMEVAKASGADRVKILKYANSGDVTGNKSRVVGYGAVAILKSTPDLIRGKNDEVVASRRRSNLKIATSSTSGGLLAMTPKSKVKGGEMLNEEQQRELLKIARETIKTWLEKRRKLKLPAVDSQFQEKRGVFVTLRKNEQLRGCIGMILPEKPLAEAVVDMAIESATADPRFPPLSLRELKEIKIEISVLTVPERVKDYRKIELGRDGVIVKRGFQQGVFLPQVATETGWTREEFLQNLCSHKAGLSENAYKEKDTELYTFQAQVFSEE